MRYRSKPSEVDAVRWTGDWGAITGFLKLSERTYVQFGVYDDDRRRTLRIFDKLHDSWVTLYMGQWLIRGSLGELYPCDHEVFIVKYEPIEEAQNAE